MPGSPEQQQQATMLQQALAGQSAQPQQGPGMPDPSTMGTGMPQGGPTQAPVINAHAGSQVHVHVHGAPPEAGKGPPAHRSAKDKMTNKDKKTLPAKR